MSKMKKQTPAANPDAYVAGLAGWRRELVETLRAAVVNASPLDEAIKWGHLVYFSNGPVLLIRAEDERVLFGFWRGQRLVEIEPRLKGGGKYDMATLELREGMSVKPTTVRRLVREAVELNEKHGDPTKEARPAKAAQKGKHDRPTKPAKPAKKGPAGKRKKAAARRR